MMGAAAPLDPCAHLVVHTFCTIYALATMGDICTPLVRVQMKVSLLVPLSSGRITDAAHAWHACASRPGRWQQTHV